MALQIEGGGLQDLPYIPKSWISWGEATPDQYVYEGGDGGGDRLVAHGTPAGYGFNTPGIAEDPFFSSPFYRNTKNYEWSFDPQTGAPTVRVKTGDKTGTYVSYVQDAAGNWVPDYSTANAQGWDTNTLKQGWGIAMPIAVGLGGYGLASALGATGAGAAAGASGASGAASAANPYALTAADFAASSAPASAWGATGAGYIPGTAATAGFTPGAGIAAGEMSGAMAAPGLLGGSVPAATSTVPTASKSSGIFSQIEQALGLPAGTLQTAGSTASSVLGGGSQSNTGGLLGGLLGAGLGYLDAKSMPDSLTIKNEIDPRLAAYAYGGDGTGGVARSAFDLMNQQLNSPNPLTQAGEKISAMSGTTPDWAALVNQNKGLWDSNPWVTQQQKAITDLTTRNLLENVIPGIGSSANMAGGYGGSRQGIMQGKAISDMNTNLAPALSNLASNAWESSQNRALQGATTAGSYGLANQQQQANLLGVGAGLQNQGAWDPITNMSNVLRGLPGNTSQTQPLFNNPIGNAIGMGSLGSQIGGGINWGDLFKNISGWFGNTPPTGQTRG